MLLGGIVALAASSFEQWRRGRWLRVRVIDGRHLLRGFAFVVTQGVAAAATGALVVAYESFIRTQLSQSTIDLLHFSLHPLDAARLAVVIGLVILHAALAALLVLLFRVARSPWVVATQVRWVRGVIPLVWAVPSFLVIQAAMAGWERPPIVPAMLIIGFAIAAAWRLGHYRALLAHASQAARLTGLFVALALPSLVFSSIAR